MGASDAPSRCQREKSAEKTGEKSLSKTGKSNKVSISVYFAREDTGVEWISHFFAN